MTSPILSAGGEVQVPVGEGNARGVPGAGWLPGSGLGVGVSGGWRRRGERRGALRLRGGERKALNDLRGGGRLSGKRSVVGGGGSVPKLVVVIVGEEGALLRPKPTFSCGSESGGYALLTCRSTVKGLERQPSQSRTRAPDPKQKLPIWES